MAKANKRKNKTKTKKQNGVSMKSCSPWLKSTIIDGTMTFLYIPLESRDKIKKDDELTSTLLANVPVIDVSNYLVSNGYGNNLSNAINVAAALDRGTKDEMH